MTTTAEQMFFIIETPFKGTIKSTMMNGIVHYTGEKVTTETTDDSGRTITEITFKNPLNFDQYNEQHGGTLKAVTAEELDQVFEEYEKSLCGDWAEIDAERYNEMLNVLPPMRWRNVAAGINVFAISEAYTGNLHSHFVKATNSGETKYFEALRPVNSKNEDLAIEIIEVLK